MAVDWLYDLDYKMFAKVQSRVKRRLQATYSDINITNDSARISDTKFPCVYVHLLPSNEVGATTEGVNVNGIKTTFQIDITAKSHTDVIAVSRVITELFKQLGFYILATIEPTEKDGSICSGILRFRKTIADLDNM